MITIATVLLIASGACFLARVVTGPSLADRIVVMKDGRIQQSGAPAEIYALRVKAATGRDEPVDPGLLNVSAAPAQQ